MNSDDTRPTPPLHSFDAEGMNTLFKIRIHHPDVTFARRLAGNCFRQLEELEALLSRYRFDSDISRINALRTGDSMLLTDEAYRCLQQALEASELTAGLFDVTLGAQTWADALLNPTAPKGKLALSPNRPEITCEEEGREIDLGGIGKGFALDEIARTLRDLGAESAIVSCGASTHLALGDHPWPMELKGDEDRLDISLVNRSLSASGLGEQGAHVVHPDTGKSPDYHFERVWVTAPSAALSDALATACLIMDEEELAGFAAMIREREVSIFAERASDSTILNLT
ncbi:MAG: FAD:protein FMN transferase [Verrucomicrobiota bacterium]